MFLKLFHLTVFLLYSYTVWYDQMYVDLPFPSKEIEDMPLKARHIFLTFWCLVLQTVYFGISLFNDIYGTNATNPRKSPMIRRIKDVVFSLALPIAIYVSTIFWTFYSINKDLIFPTEIEKLFPKWVNHMMHTMIIPFIFIELFVTKRDYPSRKFGIRVMAFFITMYTTWIHVLYFKTGVWAYPFLDLFNWPIRTLFCVFSASFSLGMYVIGEKINYLFAPTVKSYSNGNLKSH